MTPPTITLSAGFSRFERGGSPCKPFQWFIRRLEKPLKLLNHSTFVCALPRQGVHENFRWGALALDRLGPDYRIKTSCCAAGKPDGEGTLHSDLIIYGRGDPSFAARFNGGDSGKSLDPLVTTLVAAGLKRIEGDLVGDESFFRGPPFGSSWTWDDLQNSYGAEVSALSQEDNVVDLVFKSGAKPG